MVPDVGSVMVFSQEKIEAPSGQFIFGGKIGGHAAEPNKLTTLGEGT